MTQLWMDGFDHYGTDAAGAAAMLEGPWAEVAGSGTRPVIPAFGARSGSHALRCTDQGQSFVRRVLGGSETTVITGFGFYLPSIPDVDTRITMCSFMTSGANTAGTIYAQSDGSISVRGPATGLINAPAAPLLGDTTGPALVAGTWHYVEISFTQDDTVGACEIRVDGDIVLILAGLNTGTTLMNQLIYGHSPANVFPATTTPSEVFFDDIVTRNTSGVVNNDFQGDLRVAALQPIANSANQGWTGRSIQKLGVGVLRVDDNGDRNSSVTFADDAALEIAAQSYTVEGFFRFEDLPVLSERFGLASKWRTDTDNRSWKLALNGPDVGGTLEFQTSSDGTASDVVSVHAFPFIPETNTHVHVAVSRDGTDSRMFIEGAQVGITKTDSRTYFDGDALLAISGEMDGSTSVADLTGLEGWVDGFRLTIGAARYTANFTPPMAPLPITVGGDPLFNSVELLMNFDNDAVTDQSSNAFTGVLRNGAVQEIPDDGSAFQTIDGLTPNDNNFVEAALVAATGTLTFIDNPLTTETATLGGTTYNFQAVLEDTANNVLIGATAEDSLNNLLAAVNLQTGAGMLYGTGTVVNLDAQLTDLPDSQVLATASTPGAIGNSVDSLVAGALGVDWDIRTTPEDNSWRGLAFGNGLFVTVASTGAGNRAMTSPNGVNWTIRTTPEDNDWFGVAFGNGLFVAVASTGAGNRVMTSPNGVDWTMQTTPEDNDWFGVTFGNGLFVAVASTGAGNRVMTSPNGVDWTMQTTPEDNNWVGVTFGNGLFVAVAQSGVGNRVMTSPNGFDWTMRATPKDNAWLRVVHGNGLFVAVAQSGAGDRVMTSPDGFGWTIRATPEDNDWFGVAYGNGLFVAVAQSGVGNRVMTSPNGFDWAMRATPEDNNWQRVMFGNDLFVAVANSGTGNRVMTSSTSSTDMSWSASTLLGGFDIPTNSEFDLSSLPAEVTGVRAVAIVNRAFKTDSGSSALQASFVVSSGASLQGANRAVTINPTYAEDTFETDPGTLGDITPSTLKGARIRFNRTT